MMKIPHNLLWAPGAAVMFAGATFADPAGVSIGDQMEWSVENGSLPPGWYDTLEDAGHGRRIIEYVGTENPDDYFRIKVDTRISHRNAASGENQIFIGIQQTGRQYGFPSSNEGFDFEIDWGDGTVEHLTDADRTQIDGSNREGFLHTYDEPGVYEITMKGALPYWSAPPDAAKWLEISNWGTQELKACIGFLSMARNLQIVGDALKYPPVTPNVVRWHRPLQWSGSDYHPAYDTSSAHLLDRMFYGAKLKRAPPLDTGQCRNFHNFFRSATELSGAIPHYNTSKGEFFYRFFRYARNLRTEDIPPLDTSEGRVFEGMFADLPLVQRIPDEYDFSKAGEPFSDPNWVPYGHDRMVRAALSIFAAAYTGELGVSQPGDASGLAVIDNLEINTAANMAQAFRKNSGMTEVTNLNITIGSGPGLFRESAIESVAGTIARNPRLHPEGSLHAAFASCERLESAVLHLPGWTNMSGLFSGTPVRHLILDAPDYVSHFNLLVLNVSALESLELPNWPSYTDFSIQNSAMDREAIMALVASLPERTRPVTIFIAGASGADHITPDDIRVAQAKNWILSTETSGWPEVTITEVSDFTELALENNTFFPLLEAVDGLDHLYTNSSTFWVTEDNGQTWEEKELNVDFERFWTLGTARQKIYILGQVDGATEFHTFDATNHEHVADSTSAHLFLQGQLCVLLPN